MNKILLILSLILIVMINSCDINNETAIKLNDDGNKSVSIKNRIGFKKEMMESSDSVVKYIYFKFSDTKGNIKNNFYVGDTIIANLYIDGLNYTDPVCGLDFALHYAQTDSSDPLILIDTTIEFTDKHGQLFYAYNFLYHKMGMIWYDIYLQPLITGYNPVFKLKFLAIHAGIQKLIIWFPGEVPGAYQWGTDLITCTDPFPSYNLKPKGNNTIIIADTTNIIKIN